MVPLGTKMVPRGTKMIPRGTKTAPGGTRMAPRGTKMAPRGTKMESKCHQNGTWKVKKSKKEATQKKNQITLVALTLFNQK